MTKDLETQSFLVLNIGYRVPVILYCAAIFVHSSSPVALGMDPYFPGFDKILHFAGYAFLGVLVFRWLRREKPALKPFTVAVLASVFSMLYGLSDEIHQSFVARRSCEALDLLADSAGGAVGAFVCRAVEKGWRGKRKSVGEEREDTG